MCNNVAKVGGVEIKWIVVGVGEKVCDFITCVVMMHIVFWCGDVTFASNISHI